MGSPENDTIIVLLLNVMVENDKDKKRKISKRNFRLFLCLFLSRSLFLSLSLILRALYTTYYILASVPKITRRPRRNESHSPEVEAK